MATRKIPVISLFSGAMGLDLGLEKEGFEVVVAVECDPQAVATIRRNRPDLIVIDRKIETVTTQEILSAAGLKSGGDFIVSGGPSCQAFSTAGQRRSLGDPRGGLFHHFARIVQEARPRFFVMENVKGMLSAAVKHRPLNERGPGHPPLKAGEELGSAFRVVVDELKKLDYYVVFDLLNAADYGVPQSRERILFIGSRGGRAVRMPEPTHADTPSGETKQWITVRSAIGRLSEKDPLGYKLREREAKYLKLIPAGGNWKSLPESMQHEALGGAYLSWGGRSGFFRRLAWDRPSPALTTVPNCRATMLCHPTAMRVLSVKEYARIQQFPADWKFEGTIASQYRQIGNAVPVGLGAALGRAVRAAWSRRSGTRELGAVETHNADLVRKMSARPITILNPPHLRPAADDNAKAAWAKTSRRLRSDAEDYGVRKPAGRKAA
jgi:DNA (cytosine-5)-methyltransferase 1